MTVCVRIVSGIASVSLARSNPLLALNRFTAKNKEVRILVTASSLYKLSRKMILIMIPPGTVMDLSILKVSSSRDPSCARFEAAVSLS